jgi:hypothetical protein
VDHRTQSLRAASDSSVNEGWPRRFNECRSHLSLLRWEGFATRVACSLTGTSRQQQSSRQTTILTPDSIMRPHSAQPTACR